MSGIGKWRWTMDLDEREREREREREWVPFSVVGIRSGEKG